jgi:hypothetical protein
MCPGASPGRSDGRHEGRQEPGYCSGHTGADRTMPRQGSDSECRLIRRHRPANDARDWRVWRTKVASAVSGGAGANEPNHAAGSTAGRGVDRKVSYYQITSGRHPAASAGNVRCARTPAAPALLEAVAPLASVGRSLRDRQARRWRSGSGWRRREAESTHSCHGVTGLPYVCVSEAEGLPGGRFGCRRRAALCLRPARHPRRPHPWIRSAVTSNCCGFFT